MNIATANEMEMPTVTISDGKIQGTTLKSVLGLKYLAFKGIPYARPPLGFLRFKRPQAPEKWLGVLDASKHTGDLAMQYQTEGPKPWVVIGGEDCLYLNVYTNKIGEKRPVMFYIHGGGFLEGSGNDFIYGEDYMVEADIVLVSVNYRIGPMGFLNLGHDVAPGNQGLRDIIFALQWTQRNIEAFGGDPKNVTIFGNSSGSVACHLLTLLPAAKGLLHKAILQSGTVFTAKSIFEEKNSKNGFRIASLLGMDSKEPSEVAEFLQSVPARKLVALEGHLLSKWERVVLNENPYGPVFDGDHCDDPVIPLPIRELLKNDADIPIIVGHTADEALLVFAGKFEDEENYKFYNDNIDDIVKNSTLLKELSLLPAIMQDIRTVYLKKQPINRYTVWNLIRLISDITFVNTNRKIIDMRNEHAIASTYLYRFNYSGDEPTFYQYDDGPQPLKGVAHADELTYLFNHAYMKKDARYSKCAEEETTSRLVSKRLVRMWSNFAATGNPTPETDDRYVTCIWKASTEEELHYLEISEQLKLEKDDRSDDRKLYEKYRRHIYNL